jgi:hypothetical protein
MNIQEKDREIILDPPDWNKIDSEKRIDNKD